MNVYCVIRNGRVEIYRKRDGWPIDVMIGTVITIGNSEPVITLFPSTDSIELTLSDIAIIQDNWNQCEEMQRNQMSNPLDRFQFVDEKHP